MINYIINDLWKQSITPERTINKNNRLLRIVWTSASFGLIFTSCFYEELNQDVDPISNSDMCGMN